MHHSPLCSSSLLWFAFFSHIPPTYHTQQMKTQTQTQTQTQGRGIDRREGKKKKSLPDKLSRRRVVFSTDFHLWRKTLIQVFFFILRLGFSCSMQRLNPHDIFSPWSNFFCNDSQPLFLNFVALEHRANWTVDSDKSGKLHSCRKIYLK